MAALTTATLDASGAGSIGPFHTINFDEVEAPSGNVSSLGIIAMCFAVRASSLVPSGFVVEGVNDDLVGMVIAVRPAGKTSKCPGCGAVSARIHRRYRRRLTDLPIADRPVRIVVQARRFHCDAVICGRRIFAERFDKDALAPWARRTTRFDQIVYCLGLALGGQPAASFARRLILPVSNETLLRVVRRRGSPRFVAPTVIGLDDCAWRSNQRYGTIICDLGRANRQSRRTRIRRWLEQSSASLHEVAASASSPRNQTEKP